MARWDPQRWAQNEDGSYVRIGREVSVAVAEDEGYEGMTKVELEAMLEERGLTKTGTKDELVARLEEDDAS